MRLILSLFKLIMKEALIIKVLCDNTYVTQVNIKRETLIQC